MIFQEIVKRDIEGALREKAETKLSVLRMLSSALHNRGIEKRGKGEAAELTAEEATAVLRSEVKKRKDAIVEFEKGGRGDLVEKESAELKILEKYLPPELGDEDIEKIVEGVIKEIGAAAPKPFDKAQGRDFGRVMAEVMKRMKGQASGERVSEMVKKALGI